MNSGPSTSSRSRSTSITPASPAAAPEHRELRTENLLLKEEFQQRSACRPSRRVARIVEVSNAIQRVAPTDSTVLLQGSRARGRSLSPAPFTSSRRRDPPVRGHHCAAISRTLIENELFGHEGLLHRPSRARSGSRAGDGHDLLDEIGELGTGVQSKLLRVLPERRLPSASVHLHRRVDVRVICASNRHLPTM